MKIDTVRIRNFRCFDRNIAEREGGLVFRPNPGLNLLIGPNGSGKTALLEAIDIVLNADGRANRSLVTEYDFPFCDASGKMSIEVALVDIGHARVKFESDIQWIDRATGSPIDEQNIEPDPRLHREAVIIRFEAKLDDRFGDIKWDWFLPKFPGTEIEEPKRLARDQHESLGYFRIRPAISAGAFTLGEYSALGRHLRKLQYRLGRLPDRLRGDSQLPKCLLQSPDCEACPHKQDCRPAVEDEAAPRPAESDTVGQILSDIVSAAKGVLGAHGWNEMKPSLGSRYGGRGLSLAALTVGLRSPSTQRQEAFLPFEHLSAGERYSLSFALASSRIPGESFPIILMEEPETALYPSAVAKVIGRLQTSSSEDEPQVIIASHSESVLRRFSISDVFIMGSDRQPKSLAKAIEDYGSLPRAIRAAEQLIMPGGPAALFADKVLVVEGADDAVVSGYLDRLPAKVVAEERGRELASFPSSGWCVLGVDGARNVPDSVQILFTLKKAVAALFDGDGEGKQYSQKTAEFCPTFRYRSNTMGNPTLEDALLFGLPEKERGDALDRFYLPECRGCSHRDGTPSCWKVSTVDVCPREWRQRKVDLQRTCLGVYRTMGLYPPAFASLLAQLDSAKAGDVTELTIEP